MCLRVRCVDTACNVHVIHSLYACVINAAIPLTGTVANVSVLKAKRLSQRTSTCTCMARKSCLHCSLVIILIINTVVSFP